MLNSYFHSNQIQDNLIDNPNFDHLNYLYYLNAFEFLAKNLRISQPAWATSITINKSVYSRLNHWFFRNVPPLPYKQTCVLHLSWINKIYLQYEIHEIHIYISFKTKQKIIIVAIIIKAKSLWRTTCACGKNDLR